MPFVPDQPKRQAEVPYFEDATQAGGWAGHATGKNIDKLQAEISVAIQRLGGVVTTIQSGSFEDENNPKRRRSGYIFYYNIAAPTGDIFQGKIEIAALPLRSPSPDKEHKTRCMALYMLRDALNGQWFLQQLSPGYASLLPFMLVDGNNTISQLWTQKHMFPELPAPRSQEDADIIEGDFNLKIESHES